MTKTFTEGACFEQAKKPGQTVSVLQIVPGARHSPKVFSTPRLNEFATLQGLTTRTGYHPSWWPEVVVKELVDNAIDDAETHDLPPAISLTVADRAIIVEDQGAGLAPDIVARIFDYDRQTSSREAFIEPTRGAQGNALQTILAMPFVLSGSRGEIVIESCGIRHNITFAVDPVSGTPAISQEREASDVTRGTRITVKWPASLENDRSGLEWFAQSFACFNPYLDLKIGSVRCADGDKGWKKRKPNRPPVASWYSPRSLKRLMQAFAADAEQTGEPSPTVGAFVRMFAGLTSTQRAAEIVGPLGLSRITLAGLLRSPEGEQSITDLLAKMEGATKPVRPDELGKLGRDHIETMALWFGVDQDSKVEYLRETFVADGLPFIAEVAFAYFGRDEDEDGDRLSRTLVTGLNFSPVPQDPFRNLGAYGAESLGGLLATHGADGDDPVFVLVHVASPRFTFIDKGKTAVALPVSVARGLTDMVTKATAKWERQKRAEIRHSQAALRRQEALTKRDKPMSIKDAAYEVMAEAYAHAAGGVGMANARQVMYAARQKILELTAGRIWSRDSYFTQQLLPNYLREFAAETANWDVIYDDRGHFIEPHTDRAIGLGTLAVRQYLAARCAPSVVNAMVADALVRTFGPKGRYRSALFIEKEGFIPILEHAYIAERFDIALMSTKGMSVTASRQLIDALAEDGVRVFVLHDFDISGFSIRKTFTESGRRHEFKNELDFVDIGLRLDDVGGLADEPVKIEAKSRAAIANRLQINGATRAEIEFLLSGKRVELNAMTSDQFVAFVERKLIEHGAAKVEPDEKTLADAYRAFVRGERARRAFDEHLGGIRAEPVDIPPDLADRLRNKLASNPREPWDHSLREIAREDDGNAVD